jgi:uncharacterized protein YndB with AHSA1/START domain
MGRVVATVAVTRAIAAPIERIWHVLTDLAERATWLSTVYDVRVRTPGRFGVGTMWDETRALPDGALVTETFHVDQCAPPTRLVISSRGDGADYRMTFTLTPVDSGRHAGSTEVTVAHDGVPSSTTSRVLAIVLGELAARTVESALRQDLADLAAAVGPGEAPARAA